jgi:O-6-methylguanine DNA methyltransferase
MTPALTHARYETPVGELSVFADEHGVVRAAGTACGHNAVALFVPCHRVIASGGRLGQYGPGGVGIKAALLAFEAGWSAAAVLRAGRAAHPDQLVPVAALGPAAVVLPAASVRPAESVVQTASVAQPGGRQQVGGR